MHLKANQGHELPLEAEQVFSGTKDSSVEGIDEFYDAFIEEPVSDGRTALLRAELESGQMRHASSGHWSSAAL